MDKHKPQAASEPVVPTSTHPGKAISLHPLTVDQAMGAALRVKPADLKAMEEEQAAKIRSKQR